MPSTRARGLRPAVDDRTVAGVQLHEQPGQRLPAGTGRCARRMRSAGPPGRGPPAAASAGWRRRVGAAVGQRDGDAGADVHGAVAHHRVGEHERRLEPGAGAVSGPTADLDLRVGHVGNALVGGPERPHRQRDHVVPGAGGGVGVHEAEVVRDEEAHRRRAELDGRDRVGGGGAVHPGQVSGAVDPPGRGHQPGADVRGDLVIGERAGGPLDDAPGRGTTGGSVDSAFPAGARGVVALVRQDQSDEVAADAAGVAGAGARVEAAGREAAGGAVGERAAYAAVGVHGDRRSGLVELLGGPLDQPPIGERGEGFRGQGQQVAACDGLIGAHRPTCSATKVASSPGCHRADGRADVGEPLRDASGRRPGWPPRPARPGRAPCVPCSTSAPDRAHQAGRDPALVEVRDQRDDRASRAAR